MGKTVPREERGELSDRPLRRGGGGGVGVGVGVGGVLGALGGAGGRHACDGGGGGGMGGERWRLGICFEAGRVGEMVGNEASDSWPDSKWRVAS